MNPEIRPIQPGDYAGWLPLWDGNNQGARNEQVTAMTWARLNDPVFPVHGLMAFIKDKPAGLLHYVLHPTTGSLKEICYMQDVYVDPVFRRQGIARAMITQLSAIGRTRGWARIYWLAENGNAAAQSLYRNLGIRLDFSLHVMPLE